MKDVEVKAQSYQYVFFGCIEVEGTPVREVVVPAKSTKKK
ncbi:putative lipoprotein [Leptospira interrogans serovar Canicola str. Fiocruz LV133]|nr:putative lipoprotein [Leptospira interrogans serovar Canicola str. Fiocruz LV133]